MSLRKMSALFSGKRDPETPMQDPIAAYKTEHTETSYETRNPVVIVVDGSDSMLPSMKRLNQAIQELVLDLRKDSYFSQSVELSLVVVRTAPQIVQPFALPKDVELRELECGGLTALYGGILLGMSTHDAARKSWSDRGLAARRSMLVTITDGAATDPELRDAAKQALRASKTAANAPDRVLPFFFAVEGADVASLKDLADGDEVYEVTRENLFGIFEWLNASLHIHKNSQVDQKPDLIPATRFGATKA